MREKVQSRLNLKLNGHRKAPDIVVKGVQMEMACSISMQSGIHINFKSLSLPRDPLPGVIWRELIRGHHVTTSMHWRCDASALHDVRRAKNVRGRAGKKPSCAGNSFQRKLAAHNPLGRQSSTRASTAASRIRCFGLELLR